MITIAEEPVKPAEVGKRLEDAINYRFHHYPKAEAKFEQEMRSYGHEGENLLFAVIAFQKAHKYGIPYSSEILTVLPADYYQVRHDRIAGEFGGMSFEAERVV